MFRYLSEDEYHAHPAIGHTGLLKLMRSPAHYKAWLENPPEPTPAMALGRAFHCALLEPEKFAATYLVAPKFDKRTKEGKAQAEAWEAENQGKIPLTPEQADAISKMKDSVLAHAGAARLLKSGLAEQTIIWRHSGIECKCRPDFLTDEVIVEVKTTCDASAAAFSRSIATLGYDLQAAFYLTGCTAILGGIRKFVFIAVEKDPPYATAVYQASDELVKNGQRKYLAALELLKWCKEKDCWPAYQPSGEIEMIDLPKWSRFEFDFAD